MSDEKTLDLNGTGEVKTPEGTGQPGNKTVSPVIVNVDSEIDTLIPKDDNIESVDDLLGDGDEKVEVPKGLLRKLVRDKNNYRAGLLLKKKEEKSSKVIEKNVIQPAVQQPVSNGPTQVEKEAIAKACEDPIIDKYWKDIMPFYVARSGRTSTEGILSDINDAAYLWEKKNPTVREDEKNAQKPNENKKIEAAKGATGAKPTPSGDKKAPEKEEKPIIPPKTDAKNWY